ncbi:MAG TPA: AMP-binding protein, partial [Gaiellaceae bacterium]|nr:AMP-binding protein [Gaiellaceae bacterium]
MSRHTLDHWIRDRARTTPDRTAIDYGDAITTYAELDARSDELARDLRHGEVVSTLTGNSPEHVALFFACAKAGAILHPISWRLAPAEIAYQLDDAGSSRFVVEDAYRELGDAAVALADGRNRPPGSGPGLTPGDDDGLLLIYTSGTTGKPKGALLTHANCFWTNLSFDLATGIGGDDVVLACLPQFHCGGWNVQPLLGWWKGATVVVERTFDAGRALELIEGKRVTTMMGVPANYLFMA